MPLLQRLVQYALQSKAMAGSDPFAKLIATAIKVARNISPSRISNRLLPLDGSCCLHAPFLAEHFPACAPISDGREGRGAAEVNGRIAPLNLPDFIAVHESGSGP